MGRININVDNILKEFERVQAIRDEHQERRGDLYCDYYIHWTRVWEYYRGQMDLLRAMGVQL